MSRVMLGVLLAGLAGAASAVPVPKGEEKLPPPTPEQWKQSADALKQIGLAFHNYESAYASFPGNILSGDGKPFLSWRVAILPYIDEEKLFKQFRSNEPWDSAHNKGLLEKMPKLFAPVRAKAKPGHTFFQGFEGKDAFFHGKGLMIASVTDGLSNTIMVAESGTAVEWTKPADIPFDADKDLPKLGGHFDGELNAVMGDGSVMRVRKDFDPATMKLAIMSNDGNPINFDGLTPRK